MNVQSPVFVPNSSFSSSTGGADGLVGNNTSSSQHTNSNGNLLDSAAANVQSVAGGWPPLQQQFIDEAANISS
jgi:hypothetical protein